MLCRGKTNLLLKQKILYKNAEMLDSNIYIWYNKVLKFGHDILIVAKSQSFSRKVAKFAEGMTSYSGYKKQDAK